jgi:hypothetical protein
MKRFGESEEGEESGRLLEPARSDGQTVSDILYR